MRKKLDTLLDLCVSSLRRGHANLLCIVPILTDDPRRESNSSIWHPAKVQLHKSPGAAKKKALPRLAKFHSMAKIFRKKTSNPGAKYSKIVYVTVQ